MRFNKKCQILHLRWASRAFRYRLADKRPESSPGEMNERVLADSKLNTSKQCAQQPEGQLYPGVQQA